jgi:hypothetical protein
VTTIGYADKNPYAILKQAGTTMPHRFTHADEARLEGVWLTYKGRRFCAWRFDAQTSTLKTSRGIAVESATLQSETRTLEELKEELPKLALEMAREIGTRH